MLLPDSAWYKIVFYCAINDDVLRWHASNSFTYLLTYFLTYSCLIICTSDLTGSALAAESVVTYRRPNINFSQNVFVKKLKIGQYLAKIHVWTNVCGLLFGPPCTFHQRKCFVLWYLSVCLSVCHVPHIPFDHSVLERDRKCDPP